jgi:hypothetical protein
MTTERTRSSRRVLATPVSVALVKLVQHTFVGEKSKRDVQCDKRLDSLQYMVTQAKSMNLLNRGIFYGRMELAAFIVATEVCIEDFVRDPDSRLPVSRFHPLKAVLAAAWKDLGTASCCTGFVCGYSRRTLIFLVDRMTQVLGPTKAQVESEKFSIQLNTRYRNDFERINGMVQLGSV